MSLHGLFGLLCLLAVMSVTNFVSGQDVWRLWPVEPPGDKLDVGPERDFTKPEDRLIAGRRIIKLGSVSEPEMHVYLAPEDRANGSAIVICPGGGFSILAWDLEGTEVAQWLNSIGIAGIVLKYRVPTRNQEPRWLAPVQDAQRAISITRANADSWKLDADRIGILGFSAGGETAAVTTLIGERKYEGVDDADTQSCRPNLALLIYPAGIANEEQTGIRDYLKVDRKTPPIFMVHAFDDEVSVQQCLQLLGAMKRAEAPAELHVYATGGHGYGLRPVDEHPVTRWSERATDWLRQQGWVLKPR